VVGYSVLMERAEEVPPMHRCLPEPRELVQQPSPPPPEMEFDPQILPDPNKVLADR